MKLYVTHLGRWAGTQADIKPLGKEDGGWAERDVPTDKAGLIAWLNDYRPARPEVEYSGYAETSFDNDDISDLLGDDEPAVEDILSAKVATYENWARISTTQDVIDWVLDVATPHQIEGLFASLGARFHEAVKGKTND